MLIRDRRFRGFRDGILDPNSTILDPTNNPNTGVVPGTGPIAARYVLEPTPIFTPTNEGTDNSVYVLAQDGDTSIDWKVIGGVGAIILVAGAAALALK